MQSYETTKQLYFISLQLLFSQKPKANLCTTIAKLCHCSYERVQLLLKTNQYSTLYAPASRAARGPLNLEGDWLSVYG